MQDGNLDALKEVLNCGELLDLDEPSNGPIPYTALFLAYINDHFQVSWVCLYSIIHQYSEALCCGAPGSVWTLAA